MPIFSNIYQVVQYAFSDALSCEKYSTYSKVNLAIMNTSMNPVTSSLNDLLIDWLTDWLTDWINQSMDEYGK